jgi:hypothetical protein
MPDADRVRRSVDEVPTLSTVARGWAQRSLWTSAAAWVVLTVGVVLWGSAPYGVFLVALVGVPGVFVILTVLAVRFARRGRDSGYRVTTWAIVVAVLDVVGSIVLLAGLGLLLGLARSIAQCADDPGCHLFQF